MPEQPRILNKKALRDSARQKRFLLTDEEIRQKSSKICSQVLELLDGHRTVMIYCSKNPEVDTLPLISALLQKGIRVVVPIIEQETTSLRLSYLTNCDLLVRSTFSVPEPIGNEIPARPEDIELVIVPMLAFDTTGNRLGYGAGYYDRFLSSHPAIRKIGLAFLCQETPEVPVEGNDIRMDYIVTEEGIIPCTCRDEDST